MAAPKVAVVTGSNKGLGFEIIKKLCREFTGAVYLTARDEGRGVAAVNMLKEEGLNPEFHQLDILSAESIEKFKTHLQQKYGGLDVLINNAGIAFKMASTVPFPEQAEVTLRTNFTATLDVCHAFFPLLRPQARVVNISTNVGRLSQLSEDLQKKFTAETLTESDVVDLMAQFVKDVKDGVHKEKGWSSRAYGVGHVGTIALTKVQAREMKQDARGILVNACDPGHIRTDMAGPNAPGSAEQGAITPVYAALLAPGATEPNGELLKDKAVLPW